MAFDQNSVPLDLRPLNVAAAVAEEPIISPATITPPTPNSVGELFYQPASSAACTTWCVRPITHANVSPAAAYGFNYSGSSYGNRVVAGNAMSLGKLVGCNGLDKACNDANGFGYGVGGFGAAEWSGVAAIRVAGARVVATVMIRRPGGR